MTRLPLPGCWYGEACLRPDGSHGYWASPFHVDPDGTIVPDPAVLTEKTVHDTSPLGWTVGHPSGKFAGQVAISAAGNEEYNESGGPGVIVGPSYGNSPVLYLRDGTLVQSKPGQAGGLRYEAEDGTVVLCQDTAVSPDGLLANYTELAGVRVGQDQIAGLGCIIQIVATGQRFILERSANCIAIRMNAYAPNLFAIYVVKLAEQEAVCFWLTTDEIVTLEPYPAPPFEPHPITPSRSADGRLYPVAPFIHCDPSLKARGGEGQQDNVQTESPDGLIVIGKFGQATATEGYGFDPTPNWLCSLWDASGDATEVQIWGPDDAAKRWLPAELPVADPSKFDLSFKGPGMDAGSWVSGPIVAIYLDRATCHELRRPAFNRRHWRLAFYDEYDCGPDLGVRPLSRFVMDNTAGIFAHDRIIEITDCAIGPGAIAWEAHDSAIAYATGIPVFDARSLVQRVEYYRLGGSGVAPVLPTCVPPVVPHLPPWVPVPPPTFEEVAVSAGIPTVFYVSKAASTMQPGTTVYTLPNGKVFSCQPDGSQGDRPAESGAYEQGQENGLLTVFAPTGKSGAMWPFLMAQVDKLQA